LLFSDLLGSIFTRAQEALSVRVAFLAILVSAAVTANAHTNSKILTRAIDQVLETFPDLDAMTTQDLRWQLEVMSDSISSLQWRTPVNEIDQRMYELGRIFSYNLRQAVVAKARGNVREVKMRSGAALRTMIEAYLTAGLNLGERRFMFGMAMVMDVASVMAASVGVGLDPHLWPATALVAVAATGTYALFQNGAAIEGSERAFPVLFPVYLRRASQNDIFESSVHQFWIYAYAGMINKANADELPPLKEIRARSLRFIEKLNGRTLKNILPSINGCEKYLEDVPLRYSP
jgi:hypothetical protein